MPTGFSRPKIKLVDVLIDARKLRDFGIGTYIQNLAEGLREKAEMGFLCYPEDKGKLPGRCWTVRSRGYSLREQWEIWRTVRKIPHRIYHSPHYVFPILYRGNLIVTIHDIIHILFPQFFPRGASMYARAMISRAATRAKYLITVSFRSARDISSRFPAAEKKLRVIYNGLNPVFFQAPSRDRVDWARSFSPYILAVGNNKPHKRFPLLIKVFERIRKKFPGLKLLIAGWKGPVPEGVHTLGKIPLKDLAALYAEAEVLVHPSLYEGFGFPPMEASCFGVPVITARVGAVDEILGEDAYYFEGEEELEVLLEEVLKHRDQAKERARRAKEKVRGLTWERSSAEHLEVYRSLP